MRAIATTSAAAMRVADQREGFGPGRRTRREVIGAVEIYVVPGGAWKYANVDDLPKAAKDWPQINFVIYHSALRAFLEDPDSELAEFEKNGYIRWVSDLASIPQKTGVSNVYADVGTSFAISAVSNPRFCAAMMGTLIKGLGHDHVFWGTDL